MNLALHGLSGDIRLANSYYDDLHDAVGSFDFVMANPPFNVNGVDKSKLEGDTRRFPFGLPRPDNGNYLWIQLFHSALNETGRAGFVMANSASDARASEAEIRRRLIEERAVDVMIAISPNFFYTRHAAGNALVPRPRQARHAARGHRALPRRPAHIPADRPRAPRLPARADRATREHRAPLPRRGARVGRGKRGR